jgi:acyl-CoA synthetase (AMP-forming)/AMP-acid ligase II
VHNTTAASGTIHGNLAARARQTASGIALSWEHTSLTWRELLAEAVEVAQLLRRADVSPGDFVAVWGNSAVFHVVTLLGCGIVEAVQMPLNPRWSVTFLSDVASKASVLITDGRLSWPEAVKVPTTRSWSGQSPGTRRDVVLPPSEANENTVVAVNWSRGSVGAAPKGCLLTHKMILTNATSLASVMELKPNDSVAHLIPGWQHPHELIGKGLVNGSQSLILDFPYPRTALSLLARYGARWVIAAPRLIESILPFGQRVRSAFEEVDAVLLFGHYPRPQILARLEALARVRVFNGWGSSETSGIALAGRVSPKNPDNCGTPCPGYEASVQSNSGAKEGTLLIRGEGVALRYLDKTSVVDTGGWFASGDLVRLCRDNTLRVLGKPDEAVVRGGKRVPVSQIEAEIARVPGIGDVAAIPRSVDSGTMTLFIEPAEDTVELEVLSRKVRQVFGESEHPRVQFLFSLPRLPDGRVDTLSLAEGRTADLSLESLDRAILDLLNQRAAILASRVVPDTRPLSEDESVLRGVVGHNRGPLYDDSVEEIFRCILDHCRRMR